jgi:hypothetical protein
MNWDKFKDGVAIILFLAIVNAPLLLWAFATGHEVTIW